MADEIRIVVADDHPIVRNGLVQLLRTVANFSVVGEAADGAAALAALQRLRPDVAVLDVDMPPPDGLATARAAIEQNLPVALIFLTMYQNESLLNTALRLGVKGYVLKNSATEDIIEAIQAVAAGDEFVSPAMTKYLVRRSRRAAVLAEQTPTLQDLTLAERKILKLVGEYHTSQQIADLLCVSVRTVDNHRTHIAGKLNLHGKNALLRFALQHKKELS
jgi:DNA-binding NarL/FixJ family response regulator